MAIFFLGIGLAEAQKNSGENLPMYGQPEIVRSDQLKKGDEAFVRETTAKFGSREAASRALAAQGWTHFRSGNLELALQSFNRSWLLNPKYYQVFWGFGAVLSEQGKLAEAIIQLETARELIEEPSQTVALLSDIAAVHSEYAARLPQEKQLERAHHFVIANQRFTELLELEPKYAAGWREWAISLYRQERYSEAWIKAKRATELKAEPLPANFLKNLEQKMKESK